MMDDMIEAKLDIFRKLQDGITSVGFKMQHTDIPEHLASAALGKRYYLVLVDADYYDESKGKSIVTKPETNCDIEGKKDKITYSEGFSIGNPKEKSEGEKLRIRACCLCKDSEFNEFIDIYSQLQNSRIRMKGEYQSSEQWCVTVIYDYCNIKSRSELTTDVEAQKKFRYLDRKFKDWQYANQYEDNLSRE